MLHVLEDKKDKQFRHWADQVHLPLIPNHQSHPMKKNRMKMTSHLKNFRDPRARCPSRKKAGGGRLLIDATQGRKHVIWAASYSSSFTSQIPPPNRNRQSVRKYCSPFVSVSGAKEPKEQISHTNMCSRGTFHVLAKVILLQEQWQHLNPIGSGRKLGLTRLICEHLTFS